MSKQIKQTQTGKEYVLVEGAMINEYVHEIAPFYNGEISSIQELEDFIKDELDNQYNSFNYKKDSLICGGNEDWLPIYYQFEDTLFETGKTIAKSVISHEKKVFSSKRTDYNGYINCECTAEEYFKSLYCDTDNDEVIKYSPLMNKKDHFSFFIVTKYRTNPTTDKVDLHCFVYHIKYGLVDQFVEPNSTLTKRQIKRRVRNLQNVDALFDYLDQSGDKAVTNETK